jgi:DeoR family transcriptional regulator of aga operon
VLARRARKRIVLADATKIGRVALAQVCRMAEVDVLITDCRASLAQLEPLRRQGTAIACV